MFFLDNTIRDYAWGSPDAIPQLLGRPADGTPAAELWMGAHPGAPSRVAEPLPPGVEPSTAGTSLADLIATDPAAMLGAQVADAFGARLPFLFKVLAAEKPLSLQAHPSPEQAAAGFAAEEAAGVPIDAPERNYRDDAAKPELVCALTPFEALCGFAPPEVAADRLDVLGVPTLSMLAKRLRALSQADHPDALPRSLAVLLDPATRAGGWVQPAAEAAAGAADPSLALLPRLAEHCPNDPGVLVSLLLNFVTLKPGQALYLPAGNIHAYVSGLAVELMNASDNVLRAGLTPKHVDVPELLRVLDPNPHDATPLTPKLATLAGLTRYETDAASFELTRIDADRVRQASGRRGDRDRPVDADVELPAGPQILFAASGSAAVVDGSRNRVELAAGSSLFAPWSDGALTVRDLAPHTTVFRAAMPL